MPPLQIGDIKVKLLLGKHVLAKTQIPVWDVPLCADEDEEAAEDGGLQRKDTRCSAGQGWGGEYVHCSGGHCNGRDRPLQGEKVFLAPAAWKRLRGGGQGDIASRR